MADDYLKADYESIRAAHPEAALPAYDALSDEQRENHRVSYEKQRAFMDAIAKSIREGTPLPKIGR